MQIFAIKDERNKTLAWLMYYEKAKRFYIELPDDADIWETPLFLSSFLKKGQKSINAYWSEQWVNQRIVPTDRQNLGEVLRDNGLDEYDPYKLLILGNGRCAQDDYYIKKINAQDIPVDLKKRLSEKIEDAVVSSDVSALVFFKDGIVKKVSLHDYLISNREFSPLLTNEEIYRSTTISPGGNGLCWGSNLEITAEEIRGIEKDLPIVLDDFLRFATDRMVDSAEAMEMLHCTRQNLADLVRRDKLHPVKKSAKNTVYRKAEIEERKF